MFTGQPEEVWNPIVTAMEDLQLDWLGEANQNDAIFHLHQGQQQLEQGQAGLEQSLRMNEMILMPCKLTFCRLDSCAALVGFDFRPKQKE